MTRFGFVCAVLRNAFNAFEATDKKGFIPTEDLATIIEMLGHRLNDQQQKQAIREADPRRSGYLEFENFAVYASKYVDVEEDIEAVAKELREAFLLYDRDCEHNRAASRPDLNPFPCSEGLHHRRGAQGHPA